jgi:CMP-N,N'-diacetyllegionaminic acid synthase
MIFALIPARGGSKSIEKKNIVKLGDFPLIYYSIYVAKLSKFIDRVIVTTDDPEIREISLQCGAEVPFLRPVEYAQDLSGDYDVIEHFINWLKETEDVVPEMISYLRPDFPFRKASVMDKAIRMYNENASTDGLRSIHLSTEIPFKKWLVEDDKLKEVTTYNGIKMPQNQPRQLFPETYYPNGYIDIIDPVVVLENKTLNGDLMIPFEVSAEIGNSGVHSKDDLKSAREVLRNFDFT